jgi:hypothetical protein
MQHHKNSRDAASPAPPSQQQTPLAAAFAPAPQQQTPLTARRDSAPTPPAAPQSSPRYVVLRTPPVTIATTFLINVTAIRNPRKQLKTITAAHF